MQHISVDLETLGVNKHAPILSIGAVRFDPLATNVPRDEANTFYRNVNLQTCLNAGLEVDGKTFYWWIQQSQQARTALLDNQIDLDSALLAFAMWLTNTKRYLGTDQDESTTFWCHENFDAPVLDNAFWALRLTIPWSHRDWRDIRTLMDCAGWPKNADGKPSVFDVVNRQETEHDALGDAMYQARLIQASWQRIGSTAAGIA